MNIRKTAYNRFRNSINRDMKKIKKRLLFKYEQNMEGYKRVSGHKKQFVD